MTFPLHIKARLLGATAPLRSMIRWIAAQRPARDVQGYVEKFEHAWISGWARSRSGAPIRFQVQVLGSLHDIDAHWHERADVAERFGQSASHCGFSLHLPAWLVSSMESAINAGKEVEVIANGHALNALPDAGLRKITLEMERLDLPSEVGPIKGALESWGYFQLRGWARRSDGGPAEITLRCNDETCPAVVIREPRPELRSPGAGDGAAIGFSLEIPGYVWEHSAESGRLAIEVFADGHPLTHHPLEVTRQKACDWIQAVFLSGDPAQRQYLALVALEHIRYGAVIPRLEPKCRRAVHEFASSMGLEEFVFVEHEDGMQAAIPPVEEASTLLLWRALRSLNEKLVRDDASALAAVKAVLDDMRLAGKARRHFLRSCIPTLCRSGEFAGLLEVMEIRDLYALDQSPDLWEASLPLPALVLENETERATNLLWRLATMLDAPGWLNTECVRFAVDEVMRRELDGRISTDMAEKFRYAFMGILDAFKGGWFSRLHDRELILAMLALLRGLGNYTDYHKRDVVRAAIKHYGVCPDFWRLFDGHTQWLTNRDLLDAHEAWLEVQDALETRDRSDVDRLGLMRRPIRLFHRYGNPEAISMLREVLANSLPHFNRESMPEGRELIDWLLEMEPTDCVRLAAFPLAGDNQILGKIREIGAQLPQTLRELTASSEHPACIFLDLQSGAGMAMREASVALTRQDASALAEALKEVEKKACLMANWHTMYLGVDLLAAACVLGHAGGLDATPFASRWMAKAGQALDEIDGADYLPAPIQAGLRQFGQLAGDPLFAGVIRALRRKVEAKFGGSYGWLFKGAETVTVAVDPTGWPRDTLVVVYSCRKYLDSRIPAIRDTWVEDLKARGIPYLILVGDGNDRVEGDVLALDVSDKYEDLPKKTLALFSWVVRNTDFQYVLKIDDDCFLDVERFFGTLSYRKHFYYGRVIRRGVGSMDRTWHQSKAHATHATKIIDKSPEPATYADGGGAYSLARMAMLKLLQMAETVEGQRLLGCSLMEDKLVGDLLAMARIAPSNEDYESYQRRRTHSEAIPVGMWENTFFPGRNSTTTMCHLDTERDMSRAQSLMTDDSLWPKKLWQTHCPPAIGLNKNQLELLSPTRRLNALLAHQLIVVAVLRNEMVMLPHFLKHYRQLGLKCFVMVDNLSDDGTREYLLEQPDVVLFSADTEYKLSHYGVAWQQAILGNLCLNKWVLLADADELLVFENSEHRPLADLLAEVEAEGADAVRVDMIDMYPYGDLSDADFTRQSPFEAAPWFDSVPITPWRLGSGWFSNSTGFVSHLRHRQVPNAVPHDFVSQKYALFRYRPWVRTSQGVHYASNLNVSSRPAWFCHFKYHAGFKDKVMKEINRGQHFNNAFEYGRYGMMLAEGKGAFGDQSISERFKGSSSFCRLRGPR